MRLYREFRTQEELDREYNPSLSIPQAEAINARRAAASAAATGFPGARLGVRYGPTRAEYLDLFPAGQGSPVHIFVHGGYWRRYSARDFACIGPLLAKAGFTAAIVNYELCPEVTLDEVVRQVRAAVSWLARHAEEFGGDPQRISISGNSAGGHLTAMATATDWPGAYDLPADILKAALPISGLFDLAPFPFTYLQPAVQLTWDQVRRNSPILLGATAPCPVTVAVGGAESAEFRRQSQAYVDHLRSGSSAVTYLELPGRNHLDVLDEFAEGGMLLGALREIADRRSMGN